jgi:hypothetical protein
MRCGRFRRGKAIASDAGRRVVAVWNACVSDAGKALCLCLRLASSSLPMRMMRISCAKGIGLPVGDSRQCPPGTAFETEWRYGNPIVLAARYRHPLVKADALQRKGVRRVPAAAAGPSWRPAASVQWFGIFVSMSERTRNWFDASIG